MPYLPQLVVVPIAILLRHPDSRGFMGTDKYQRVLYNGSPVPGVFALGDVSSPFQLKHVANHEARTVQHNLSHPR